MSLELLFKMLLIIHIIAGSIGLIAGTINITRKKGDKLHKNIGLFFLYGMLVNGFAGIFMSLIHSNLFLLIIGVFSIYMAATGQRYLSLKKINEGEKVKSIDWILSCMMLLFGIGFVVYGAILLFNSNNFGIVLLVFGFISCSMVLKDFKNYQGKNTIKNFWLLVHIQRMIGSYIAAATAFLVVNNTLLPGVVAWLLPTVILTPLIFKWSNKYKIVSK
ncbi:hypothetical protein [Flavobacterium sp.]|uniref:hypothetical protein n=1 Tax=Flavobacterium sp. TaxID=239 RepID=UPI00375327B6